ncbi:hypothetical protein EVAR_103986_1 [Eumeta japonica]|uniref:Uncharacterized protein n=1 Tax=Eumeta variegata TaxID=151549 RepID=A0A4C1XWV0_EUMVA|nr:hypothetical protein EVAR_103986_1 [Eumeta japonica]
MKAAEREGRRGPDQKRELLSRLGIIHGFVSSRPIKFAISIRLRRARAARAARGLRYCEEQVLLRPECKAGLEKNVNFRSVERPIICGSRPPPAPARTRGRDRR